MQTISAKVNPRLLSKADRLFTGTLEGRIIEILQNARRAGATHVRIHNKTGCVTVEDNGCGITDFQKLLDLGGSGWDEKLEQGEDPAGVGLFCLAPRNVTIASGNKSVTITPGGWTGEKINVTESDQVFQGTRLEFCDDQPWDFETVQEHAVFSGLKVVVDGKYCHNMPFCSAEAAEYPDLGCQVEVTSELSNYHRKRASYYYRNRILINFHGQVVELEHWPGDERLGIHILVNLTDRTAIRLMLPARTKVVENAALEKLKAAIEVEYYRYFQRQKEHSLSYREYLRAKELGIDLPEAKPVYSVSLLHDSYDMAVQVIEPKNFKISDGYLCLDEDLENEHDSTNVHLLAALGKFNGKPFVPVMISSGYFGYSWANLPKVTSVKVTHGKERLSRWILSGTLVCVESLSITVNTSDGKVFESNVPLAIIDLEPDEERRWYDESVYITESARQDLEYDNLWYHLGGYNEEGDTYDTQQYDVEKELNEFWAILIGPYEQLRHELISQINLNYDLSGKWQRVVITEDGTIAIHFKDGHLETVKRPQN
jgi:hypothetical protein